MRAHVELTPHEKGALSRLTGEEREAVIEQMLERVREELEWAITLENARTAAASAPAIAIAADPGAVRTITASRYCWPSTAPRTR